MHFNRISLGSSTGLLDADDQQTIIFKFTINPIKLDPGVHTAKILTYNSNLPKAGSQFFVPITILKPLAENASLALRKLEFASSETKRYFLTVPEGTIWMDKTIKD